MPTADVRGLKMYYEVHGSGVPLILISPLSGDHLSWAMQLPALTEAGYQCIVFDNRDVGQTDQSPVASYGIKQFADDTLGLLDAIGITAAHVVGASMGGMIGQEIAIDHPDRVISLTLACTMPGADPALEAIVRGWRALRPHVTHDEFFHAISPWLFTHRFYQQPEVLRGFVQLVRNSPFPQPPASFLRQCDAVLTHDAMDRLPAITAPTHVVVGAEDIVTPPYHARALAARVPGAKLTEIPASGHGLFWESVDPFNRATVGFLASCRT